MTTVAQHLQRLWCRMRKPVAPAAAGQSPSPGPSPLSDPGPGPVPGPAPATVADSTEQALPAPPGTAGAIPTILQSQNQPGQPGQGLHLHGQSQHFALWGSTRVGRSHAAHGKPCEDSVAARFTAQGALHAALADGVSSGARGDVASQAMVQFAVALPVVFAPAPGFAPGPQAQAARSDFHAVADCTTHPTQQHLAEQLAQADVHVAQALAAAAPGRSGATTSAAVWVGANGLAWFNRVGDCRVWHWRTAPGAAGDVTLTLAAQDQTFTALGEDPPPGVPPHNPARMVGNGRIGQPEVQALQLQPGDGLLLSSDGLHDVLSPDHLRRAIAHAQRRGATLRHLGRLLQRLARLRGSTDDIALIVLRWGPAGQTSA